MNRVLDRMVTNRMRKRLAWALGLFLFYIVFGFFILPPIVRTVSIQQLSKQFARPVTIQQVRINPLSLSVTVRGLAVKEKDNQPFVSWDEFYANFQLSSLFRWMWTFDEIYLREPRVQVVLDANGRPNFADLMTSGTNAPPSPEAPTQSGLPRLLIFSLAVTNGHLGFADLSRQTPFRTTYEPFHFHLTRFTTRPDRSSPYSFAASSDSGARLTWSGQVTAQPLASRGALRLDAIPLAKHAPYLEDYTRAQLVDGRLDMDGGYHFASGTNGMDLTVTNLTVNLTQLSLKDPDTGEAVLALPSCELRGGQLDWRSHQARVSSLRVSEPFILARRRADGAINLLSLVVPRPAGEKAPTNPPSSDVPVSASWVFTLDDCQLERGVVEWEDAALTQPFRTTLKPVTLRVERFTTEPGKNAALQASIITEAAEEVNLQSDCSLAPNRASGQLKLAGLELKKYQPYLAPFFSGQIASGKTDVALEFAGQTGTGAPEVTVSNATIRVSDLQVQPPDGSETWIKLPGLNIESVSASLAEKLLRVGAIKSAGAVILARRETNGAINLLRLRVANASNPPVARAITNTPSSPPAAGWQVMLQELALSNYALHLEDRQLPQPGVLAVDQLALGISGAQFPSNVPVSLNFAARVNAAGAVTARGSVWPFSPAADTEVEVAGLELSMFQPWLQPQVKLSINSGALSLKGRVKLAAPGATGPRLHWDGDLAVTNLLTTDQVLSKEYVRWEEFALNGLEFGLQPNQLSARQARFAGLRTSVILDPEKRLNLLAVLPASSSTNPAPAPSGAPASKPASPVGDSFPIQLDELAFEKAAIHFEDQSIQPHCVFNVQQFSGAIKGLSTKPGSAAEVQVAGMVDESSPFELQGRVSPVTDQVSFHLTLTNRNLQLTPFTPYMEKYAGYPLNKGRLSLALDYALQEKTLKAQNKVRIDQLMLGQRNQSPDATDLPVKLAVSLLKDNEGQIELDIPVAGRLDDPQFKVAPIIFKVIGNLIVKAAASPFKLLGSLVGGGEEMSFVEFAPGLAQLEGTETNKLGKLIEALEKRPALSLEIEGSIHPEEDRDAMARRIVQERIKNLRFKEISGIGQPLPAGENFQLDPADAERLLRAHLIQTFGTNLTEAMRALSAPTASTNRLGTSRSAANDPSLLKRWLSVFKPKQERAAMRQAHRQAKADEQLLKQNPELAPLTIEDMESLLASKTEVPWDDLRQLMQDRAKAVQAFLLNSGKISADRLFLVTPKTPDASFKGENRVNLSLN